LTVNDVDVNILTVGNFNIDVDKKVESAFFWYCVVFFVASAGPFSPSSLYFSPLYRRH
jgi:hypothetical protein